MSAIQAIRQRDTQLLTRSIIEFGGGPLKVGPSRSRKLIMEVLSERLLNFQQFRENTRGLPPNPKFSRDS